jgi:hypothetical protein
VASDVIGREAGGGGGERGERGQAVPRQLEGELFRLCCCLILAPGRWKWRAINVANIPPLSLSSGSASLQPPILVPSQSTVAQYRQSINKIALPILSWVPRISILRYKFYKTLPIYWKHANSLRKQIYVKINIAHSYRRQDKCDEPCTVADKLAFIICRRNFLELTKNGWF